MTRTYDISEAATGLPMIGAPEPRYDGRMKVTGQAVYAADAPVSGTLHAALVLAPQARGTVSAIDAAAAEAVPGVRLVLSHLNYPSDLEAVPTFATGGTTQASWQGFESPELHFAQQPVALVVADTIQNAREGAKLVSLTVADPAEAPVASIFAEAAPEARDISDVIPNVVAGDVDAALSSAAHVVEARYTTPFQHHNPIELYATTAEWRDGGLIVQCPSQWMTGTRAALATKFGLAVERVRVIAAVTGGGFGSKATVMAHTFLAAQAARMVGRPVKLYLSRHDMWTAGSHRPESSHDLRVGMDAEGRLTALDHAQVQQTSRMDDVPLPGTEMTTRMYGWNAVRGTNALVSTDTNTPGFMRSPAEVPAFFALESAIDELCVASGRDPVEVRLASDSMTEPVEGLPWTSRSLAECLRRGAEVFGWEGRSERPGTRTRDGLLIGHGVASAMYPIYASAAVVDVRLGSDLSVRVSAGAQDIGGGTYNVLTQMAAATLGVPLANVTAELGDSDLAPNGVAGGSRQTASLTGAVKDACEKVIAELAQVATKEDGPLAGADPASATVADGKMSIGDRSVPLQEVVALVPFGVVKMRGSWIPASADPKSIMDLYRRGATSLIGFTTDTHARSSFGANFVEVSVDPVTFEIRVPRMVGAFAAGRILNEMTTRSQLMGGMIWGVGSALHEQTEVDPRAARFVNADLGEYFVPVNADVPEVAVEIVPEEDPHINPLGMKGVGELGITGMAAAIANAVYDATGVRLRDLPIRMEHVLQGMQT
ncbi:xanthine dehydrogenase family protein molybdopterin-binding subunit [Jannaschia aquimarina]|uniref:XdhA_3 protein n=1 Tax=Jannaschia aquimarina TaxID=935700 RepID=A0A0D1CRY0_9RHOB|nr:xanthine dehydrogenase family protein molybdopterin-binding subunit [Jannaschia aquimarina]KIT17562.1 Xanthine dehydrogenase molybdenum-binding subunit [Jannaschia aquimarina]SNS72794.1 xanthine dehydrogenase YagR molybdenum-binding subunit [Jannaschia aquimarina]